MKINLNDRASELIEKLAANYADRKLPKDTWSQIYSEALLSIPESFWHEQIEARTPTEFLVERALKNPELAKEMAEFLRAKSNSGATETREVESPAEV